MPTNWDQERKNLGVDPDVEIAERLGISREAVRRMRNKLGIARPTRKLERRERREGTADIVECLRAVPLSSFDRQLLTDARVAKGWSQTELARRLKSTVGYVNIIESGKAAPSPEYLTAMCKALGLRWSCNFQLLIVPQRSGGGRPKRR